MPDIRDIHADPILTDVAVRYSNDEAGFIAEDVFPTIPVTKESGIYFEYDKANLRRVDSRRRGKARAKMIEHGMTKKSYGPLEEHSLQSWIDKQELNQADDPIEPRTDHTETVMENMMIEKEASLAAHLADAAVTPLGITLSGGNQWSDPANSDPFGNITTGIKDVKAGSLKTPNTLILSWIVWLYLRNHPDFIARIGGLKMQLEQDDLKILFPEIKNILIGSAQYDTADEGATTDLDYIWGANAFLAYIAPRPAVKTVSAGYHLQLIDKETGAPIRETRNWERDDGKGEFVQVTDYYEQKDVATSVTVYRFTNAVANS